MAELSGRPVDDERRAWLWSRIRRLAALEGVPVAVRHVCAVAITALDAKDVVVYQAVEDVRSEPVSVRGPLADRLSEAQVTFGEGPSVDCLREEYPVLATDLTSRGCAVAWPFFTPFALGEGVAAVFALPVMMGAIVVGCLEAHRTVAGALTDEQLVDGLLLADAVMMLLLRSEPAPLGTDPFSDAVEARWATVHQATGVASVQLGSDLTTAFARLRAHAYLSGTRLADVAADVLAHKLTFRPDPGVEPDPPPGSEQG